MYDCIHQRHQCDILLRAAKTSCVDMQNKRERFNHQGKLWINATAPCMNMALIEEYKKTEHNCDVLTKFLKTKSTRCALDVTPNLCTIFADNKEVLMSNQNNELSDSMAVMWTCGSKIMSAIMS